jgi:hypothetical protein
MWNNFIGRQVSRANRNLLIVNLLILVGIGFAVVMSWNFLTSFFGTPKRLTNTEIAVLRYAHDSGRVVHLSGNDAFRSGYQYLKDGAVVAEFLVLDVGGQFILVKASPRFVGAKGFTGAIESIPGGILPDVTQQLQAMYPDRQVTFADYMLNAYDYQEDGWLGLVFGVPLLGLSLWNLDKWRRRNADMNAHPAVAALKVAGTPWQVAQAIEGELPTAQQFKDMRLTTNWLLAPTFFNMHVRRLQDLLWVHGQVVKHYHGFIPTGKTHAVMVYDRNGVAQIVVKNEKMMDEAVAAIAARAPHVAVGHSPEVQAMYEKNREEFVAAVEERKQGKAMGAGV